MTDQVYVTFKDGVPTAAYSSAQKMVEAEGNVAHVRLPLDPPPVVRWRVKMSLNGINLNWETTRGSWDVGFILNERYWGDGYFVWYVMATSSEEATEIAKGLLRESI